jgi:hypothetical protein
MAKYTGLQSILNAALNAALGEYQAKGFRLIEQGDHVAILYYSDEQVAVFGQQGMTIMGLQMACQEYLEKMEAGKCQA